MSGWFSRHRKLHLWLLADLVFLAAYDLARRNRAWMNALTEHVTGPHLWLLADLVFLAAYDLARRNRAWMNALTEHVTGPIRQAVGRLCYRTELSMMEVLSVLAVLACAAYLVWSVIAVIRAAGHRGSRAYSAVLGAACAGLTFYAGTCLLWGACFWTDSFQDRSGIHAQPVAREELLAVTEYFAARTAEAAAAVPREWGACFWTDSFQDRSGIHAQPVAREELLAVTEYFAARTAEAAAAVPREGGLFAVPREEILADSVRVYDRLEEQMPWLEFDDPGVKPMAFSRLMSMMDFTGFYCAWTGESNVNVDSPACLLPSTVAHELAHQRGIASEQECNFLGVLASVTSGLPAYDVNVDSPACLLPSTVAHELAHQRGIASEQECNFLGVLASVTSGLPAYEYAGWLSGYIYLGNALYRADPEAYWAIRESLPEPVQADLRANNAYWKQFEHNPVQAVSSQVYDGLGPGGVQPGL